MLAELRLAARKAAARDNRANLKDIAADLPDGWSAHVDKKSGKTYFYHKETKKSTWKRPSQ